MENPADYGEPIFCRCGVRAQIKVSRRNCSIGRRFYGCAYYEVGRGCNFFMWHDQPIQDQRAIEALIELKDVNRSLASDNRQLRQQIDILRRQQEGSHSADEDLRSEIFVLRAEVEMLQNKLECVNEYEGKKSRQIKLYKMALICCVAYLMYEWCNIGVSGKKNGWLALP